MPDPVFTPVVVTQEDREAAADQGLAMHSVSPLEAEAIRRGEWDELARVQAFARYRIAALKKASHLAEAVEALKCIASGEEPRPVGAVWRDDGKPSKHDKCAHGGWMYEDCGECIAEFARSVLTKVLGEDGAKENDDGK